MKREIYSIRKFKNGVASVLLGTLFVNGAVNITDMTKIANATETESKESTMPAPYKAKAFVFNYVEGKDSIYSPNKFEEANLVGREENNEVNSTFYLAGMVYNTNYFNIGDVIVVQSFYNNNGEKVYNLLEEAETHPLFKVQYSTEKIEDNENSVIWSDSVPEDKSTVKAVRYILKDNNTTVPHGMYKNRIKVERVKTISNHEYANSSISTDNGISYDRTKDYYTGPGNETTFFTTFELEDGTEIKDRLVTDVSEQGSVWRFSNSTYYMSGNTGNMNLESVLGRTGPLSYNNKTFIFEKMKENSYPLMGITPSTPDSSLLTAFIRLVYVPEFKEKAIVKFVTEENEEIVSPLMLEGDANTNIDKTKIEEIVNDLISKGYVLVNNSVGDNVTYDHNDSTTQEFNITFKKKAETTVTLTSVDENNNPIFGDATTLNNITNKDYDFTDALNLIRKPGASPKVFNVHVATNSSAEDVLFKKVKENDNETNGLEWDYASYVLKEVDKSTSGTLSNENNVFKLTYKRMLEDVVVDSVVNINFVNKKGENILPKVEKRYSNTGKDKSWNAMYTNGMNGVINRETLRKVGISDEDIPWEIEYNNTKYNISEYAKNIKQGDKEYTIDLDNSDNLVGSINSKELNLTLVFKEVLPATIVYIDEDGGTITETEAKNPELYTFIEDKEDNNPETETKVYHKIVTKYVDNKTGDIIEEVNGKVAEHKEIAGHTYVTTETLSNGDIVHKYNKVPTITYIDEEGLPVDKVNAENPSKYKVISEKDKGNGAIEKVVHKIVTNYVDENNKVIETVEGKVTEHKEIEGYTYITTETLSNGDIVHKYNKVPKIKYVTPEGEEIPDTDGADFEDEYTLIEEKQGADGDTIRVLHKITTYYVDEKENTIEKINKKVLNHKEIPNYTYVSTETKDNGDIIHKYNKVPTITYVDENGLPVDKTNAEDPTKYKVINEKDKDNGDVEKTVHKIVTKYVDNKTGDTVEEIEGKVTNYKEIPNYTYVTTETLPNGDIIHKYSKNPTIVYTDENGEILTPENALDINKYTPIRESGDKDKNIITKVYHKITTIYKDDTGKIIETVDGKEIAPKVVEGYTHTNTTVEDDGDVVHTYSKIPNNTTITYVNKDGESVPKVDAENPNKYVVVSEKEKGNGAIERVVHKIVTKYVDNKTGDIIEEVEGKVTEHKEIPNYTYTTTELLDNEDIVHKYNKVPTITYVDENGLPVDKVNAEDPTKYKVISEKDKGNGNIERIAHKIVTNYIDENNKVIVTVEGKVIEHKEIDGYTYITTETRDNGDVIHKYNKAKDKISIIHKDEDGNILSEKDAEDLDKYYPIKEEKINDKTVRTYHKIITTYVDENGKVLDKQDGKDITKREIPNYTFNGFTIKQNGDIIHKYIVNKVENPTIVYTDENGEILTPENALDSTKYSSIRENVDKDKNVITKVYHKIITNYVDEDNKVIGTVEDKVSEHKEINGYTYITTETLSNGDVVHKYNKVKEEDVNSNISDKNNKSNEDEIETNNKETLDNIYTTAETKVNKEDSTVNKEKVDTLKALPKTNTNSTYMYTLTSLVGLALLLKRKQRD